MMDGDASTATAGAAPPKPKKKGPPGTLLFVPAALNRGAFIQWLKRIHAWTGFWGALAFLLLGTSGLLLNHRATLKIDTGEPREVSSVTLNVDPALITSPEDLGKWAQAEFGTSIEPRAPRAEGGRGGGGGPPRGEGGPRAEGQRAEGQRPQGEGREGRAEGGQPASPPAANAPAAAPAEAQGERASFMGREVREAPVWRQSFNGPNGVLNVEYTPGANTVKATRTEQNMLGFLKNLHKGGGMSWVWVLFIDTMAGGLIAMSLTGALLWSRLHGPRLAALGIVGVSLGLALFAAWPTIL